MTISTGKEAFGHKTINIVTTRPAKVRRKGETSLWQRRRWWFIGSLAIVLIIVMGSVSFIVSRPKFTDPPEAARVLAAQEGLRFGILIPAYMPPGFDREHVDIKVTNNGPSGEPMVDLAYRWKQKSAAIFLRQWVPGNPALETLWGSRPIETKWGNGWLLTESNILSTVWVDIGQLRVQLNTANLGLVSREELVMMANTMGLASDQQVYTFVSEPLVIKGVQPPPPVEIPLNSSGVQELNLTITPGGYSPIRFAVKKDIPVKVTFRALGQVGCGNAMVFRTDTANTTSATLHSATDSQSFEFTPRDIGQFEFNCSHFTFRGVMTVRQ